MINSEMCIGAEVSVKSAMERLDHTEQKILFITESGKLLATLTDGDIRRYLLGGGRLDDMALDAGNKKPRVAKDIKQARHLYHKKNYIAIPIVNDLGIIEEIFFDGESREKQFPRLNIPVVINAGGKGTRLDPYTKVLPKPLIPVGELPIIEHIMQHYMQFGCDKFHVIVNYKKQLIKAYFNENDHHYNLTWYDEEHPLGTGGGLSLLRDRLEDTFFFTNCDILLQSNYDSMLRFHHENKNTITMVCAYKNLTIPYGVVEMGKDGSIQGMKEKPELSFLTNTGMYIVEPEVLKDIEDNMPIGFPDIVKVQGEKGRNVAVYPVSENEWMDMGQLPELEKMNERLSNEYNRIGQ